MSPNRHSPKGGGRMKRLTLLMSVLWASTALAQELPTFEYAVKFVCGKADNKVVAPGEYFTAINVHNPDDDKRVGLRKKFAIALPGEKAGKVSRFYDAKLGPDEAFEIDCPDILRHLE